MTACAECGSSISARAVGGLCPRCVAAALAVDPVQLADNEAQADFPGAILGMGGMGVVYADRDEHLGREVAVKRLRPERARQAGAHERFIAEAQIASQLEHPCIVPVYRAGLDEEGHPFYEMRRVRGVSLAEVLQKLAEPDATMAAHYPLGVLLSVFQKVCDAVAYAHSRGVIHRDLKPENIMLGEFGEVLVMDWGLAKLLDEQTGPVTGNEERVSQPSAASVAADTARTLDHTIVGTLGFMAPELAHGRAREADERSDIYALGAILYSLLTLRAPIRGTDADLMLERARSGDIRPPTDFNPGSGEVVAGKVALPHCPNRRIPAALSAVAMKAMANDPRDRYQHVQEIQREIAAWQSTGITAAENASAWRMVVTWLSRHRIVVTVATLVLALILASAWMITGALGTLRRTSPAFYALARQAIDKQDLDDALRQISYALALVHDEPEFLNLKANILQAQLRVAEARRLYARALALQPDHAAAATNLNLCDQLLAATEGAHHWDANSLEQLHSALVRQGRHAEAVLLARRMKHLDVDVVASWNRKLANAGLDGKIVRLPDGSLSLDLSTNGISDVTVLSGIPLNHLKLNYTQVTNLDALGGMPLASLEVMGTKLSSLQSVRGLPLERLYCPLTRINDLAPLAGTRLRSLDISFTKVSDLTPLKGLPLEGLGLQGTRVQDLTPLSGLALRSLSLWETPVRDLGPLRGVPLVALHLPFSRVNDLSPLEGAPLEVLDASSTQVSDLGPLTNCPLRSLDLNTTRVEDLRPLRGMQKLRMLHLGRSKIKDIAPLKGLRVGNLWLDNTFVADIGALRGMPLQQLRLDGCTKLKDVSPLLACPNLEYLTVPVGATNIVVLRHLPRLKRIGHRLESYDRWNELSTPEEFWRRFESARPPR